ncbi:unnamed protein product [Prunus armeniaca]
MQTVECGTSPELFLARIIVLLKCFKWLSGSESPLKGVMDGVVNRFGGAACSTSSVKGEEFT